MNNNDENTKNVAEAAPFSTPEDMKNGNAKTENQDEANELENLSDAEIIDLFVEGLMEEKGIEPGDEPYKNDIFVDLKNQLMSEIDRSLIAELPEDKLDEFNKMVENGEKIDPAAVSQAVIDAKLDVSEIALGTMARFKELYLNGDGEVAETKDGVAEDKE